MTSDRNSGLTRRTIITGAAIAASAFILPSAANPNSKIDLERFIRDCVEANKESEAQSAVLEVLASAVSNPKSVLSAVGAPTKAGIRVLHRSKTLTIFAAAWTPQMNLLPHDHLMWANIGIYTGREDNLLWRKENETITAYGAEALFEGDVAALPPDAIHSVTNPLLRYTGGIHIYGGDFFATTRTQWNPETLAEEPSDGAVIRNMFKRENERFSQREKS